MMMINYDHQGGAGIRGVPGDQGGRPGGLRGPKGRRQGRPRGSTVTFDESSDEQ